MKRTKLFAILLVLVIAVCALSACGECAHEYEGGACTKCTDADPNYTPPCEHTFEGGACTACGAADPDYAPVCEHTFEGGECTKCHEPCNCVFAGGVCVFCKKACECDFENGACTVCGKACECSFEMGACTICGKACKCAFVNGVCVVCGKACNCNFENGACTVCGKACECSFEMGACTVCGKACECEFALGTCTVCGAADPEFDGRELYKEMIEKFKYLVKYVGSNYELPPMEENPTVPNYDALYLAAGFYDPSSDSIGYSYKDINGDGLVELFIIGTDSRLYAIFTLKDGAPVTVKTFQNGLGYLHKGKNVFYMVKDFDENGGQIKFEFHYTALVDTSLVGFAYGWEDHDLDETTEDIYYTIGEDGVRVDFESDEQTSAKEKYKLYSNYIYEYFSSYATRTSTQSNLMFHSAIKEVSSATLTADFSSYEAIIKTFGLIHSDVAGGKYSRSGFAGGKYKDGMIFESEADFVIYNRLIAACALSQNSNSATFGYARRDLNGDGTDELILLEGTKRYVLAIFTELDGKPVLLDSYNDIRVAFIDSDGFIHVYERIIPGSKKDFEYYVYTVETGKLVAKEIFGVKYNANGTIQEAWYKIVDDRTVSIEKTEYETLFEEYFSVVGTSLTAANCAKYNLEKSGLEFVLVSPITEE